MEKFEVDRLVAVTSGLSARHILLFGTCQRHLEVLTELEPIGRLKRFVKLSLFIESSVTRRMVRHVLLSVEREDLVHVGHLPPADLVESVTTAVFYLKHLY